MKGPRGVPGVGIQVPLNVVLKQEIERFQRVLTIVRTMMKDICLAIDGTIIMTPALVDAIDAIYAMRVPKEWYLDPTGA